MHRRRSGAGWPRSWAGGIEVATGASEYAGRAGRSSPFALLNLPACPIGIDADTPRTYRIRWARERQGDEGADGRTAGADHPFGIRGLPPIKQAVKITIGAIISPGHNVSHTDDTGGLTP
jgi:hypothetical protein